MSDRGGVLMQKIFDKFVYSLMAAVIVLILLILAACNPITRPSDPPNPLAGETWLLQSIDGEAALPDAAVTLAFDSDGDTFQGDAGCNSYSGSYELSGDTFGVLEVMITEMYCPEPGVMAQEARYVELLGGATAYTLEGDTLTLRTDAGETLTFTVQ